jgi:transcriptional regulator with XRE-family HTH domain
MTAEGTPAPARGGKGGVEPRAVIDAREERAWALRVDYGKSHREIAAELGVSQPAVTKLLRRVSDRYAKDQTDVPRRWCALLVARHERLYRRSVEGYEQSQTEETRRRQRQTTPANGSGGASVVEVEGRSRVGDPGFLEQAGRALERIARLLGLEAGDRRAGSRTGADPTEARRRLARHLADLAARVGPDALASDADGGGD